MEESVKIRTDELFLALNGFVKEVDKQIIEIHQKYPEFMFALLAGSINGFGKWIETTFEIPPQSLPDLDKSPDGKDEFERKIDELKLKERTLNTLSKANCITNGGEWIEDTNECLLPTKPNILRLNFLEYVRKGRKYS